ncbi:hypothetical protein SAMN05216216_10595 [Lacicoccus qingdaonensis]|uniref:Uncharacterized protein n=1 Tax=Lacicoccus qingdaonensis TaxID=576118 RepID=A0A1G9D8T0_9BACL|nr:hypothetical protein SAMN05216216_10595 [Salinicoccus qingdaonensis]
MSPVLLYGQKRLKTMFEETIKTTQLCGFYFASQYS